MRTSFISVKITPPIGVPLAGNGREDSRSRGVHDDLFANFAYLETGGHKHLFIGMDLIGIKRSDADAIKSKIGENSGLQAESITIAATHTHSGPNTIEIFKTFLNAEDIAACAAYRKWLINEVASAAPGVISAAAESQMGYRSEKVEGFSFNRRVLMKDGSLKMVFEPYDRGQISCLAGPNGDPVMHVFLFTDMNTKIKGIIVQYTSHPAVVCGEDWLYTRDYVHMLTEYLKQRYGKDTVIVYMNGAQGNQVAADPYKTFITGFDEADRVGKGLGEGAARIIDRILAEGTLARDVPLRASETSVDLPIRKISREETDRARLMLLSCKKGAQLHGLDPQGRG
jgi:hypothetical protein